MPKSRSERETTNHVAFKFELSGQVLVLHSTVPDSRHAQPVGAYSPRSDHSTVAVLERPLNHTAGCTQQLLPCPSLVPQRYTVVLEPELSTAQLVTRQCSEAAT
eukprot:1172317-Rhodomonas_salina.1